MGLVNVSVPEHIKYPRIEPVPEGVHRPFWSVMIPTYNCAEYLERTLKSVLEQDLGPGEMQIEVVDDFSTKDDPEAVVKEVGKGRVSFFRQPQNVGISANFTTCVQRAKGKWIHILHGDDMVMPGFYDMYKRYIEKHPEIGLVFCRAISVDENDEWQQIMYTPPGQNFSGIVENAAFKLIKANFILAPTVVIPRHIYERIGVFHPYLSHTADWEMWMRTALITSIGYIHHPYLLYRIHAGSDTNRIVLNAQNIEEIVCAAEFGLRRIPREMQNKTRVAAYRGFSVAANHYRNVLHGNQKHAAALRHAIWALRLQPSPLNLLRAIRSTFLAAKEKALIGYSCRFKKED